MISFWWIFGRLVLGIRCINMALEVLGGSLSGVGVAIALSSPYTHRGRVFKALGNAFNDCLTKFVDQIIYDKTTQCIIPLTASRLSNPNLPSALTKENESSRIT